MRSILLFATLLLATSVFAQDFEPVNMKKIKEDISDSSASTYYPNLLKRINEGDTSLSIYEFRSLYYGWVYQPGYAPYSNQTSPILKKLFDEKKFEEVLSMTNSLLAKNPVAIRTYYYKLISLINLNRMDSAFLIARNYYVSLLQAINSSGDGKGCKTGFKVITVSDEYEFMYNFMEIQDVISQALETPCDRINIKASDLFPYDKIYFDVSEPLNSLNKM